MAWQTITANDGIFNVDWQAISRLVRSYHRSEAMLGHSSVNTDGHWYGPTMHTVDVDWEKVRKDTDEKSEIFLRSFYFSSAAGMRPKIGQLVAMVDWTRVNNGNFQKKMRDAQHQTMESLRKTIRVQEVGLKGLEGLRDGSAEFLMVSATIVSGGTVPGMLAIGGGIVGGAGLKTAAKFQDAKYRGHDPSKIPSNKQLAGYFLAEFGAGLIDLAGAKYIEGAAKAAEHAALHAGATKLGAKAAEKGKELGLAILWNTVKNATVEPAKGAIEASLLGEEDKSKGFLSGSLKGAGGTHNELARYLLKASTETAKGKIIAALVETTISRTADVLADVLTDKEPKESETHTVVLTPKSKEQILVDALVYESKVVEQTAIRQVGSATALNSVRPKPSQLPPLAFRHTIHAR